MRAGTGRSPTSPQPPGDLPAEAYRRMAFALRLGLSVAVVILAAAIGVLVARSPWSAPGGWVSPNPVTRYLDPRGFVAGIAAGSPEAYLTLGVLVLIATPVVRVATGTYAFYFHGERRMTVLTAVVLSLLLFGLFVVGPLVR